ncbi:efflux RND transporter periplasmic adaptor subunit [Chitinophagaceae bacterium LWZ2-11]
MNKNIYKRLKSRIANKAYKGVTQRNFNSITGAGNIIKTILIIAIVLLSVSAVITSCKSKVKAVPTKDSTVYYTCSMHPQIMQDHPGNCPICGMKLIEAGKRSSDNMHEIELSMTQLQLGNIHTDTIKNGTSSIESVLTATLNFNQNDITTQSTRVAGRVEKLYFKNTGDYVKKGDRLFDIYSEELNNAKQEYILAANRKTLNNNSSIDFNDLIEGAKNKLLLWGLNEQQIIELSKTSKPNYTTTFYSANDGYITQLGLKEGDYAAEGSPIITLAHLNTLWAEAQVYTFQLSSIDKNASVTVKIPDMNNLTIQGKIDFVNPEINPDTRINLLRIKIPNTNLQLHPGMPAYVYIKNPARKGISLPIDAVLRNGKEAIVWVRTGVDEHGQTFTMRSVETGAESGSNIEIISGVEQGDVVVTSGAYLLNSEHVFRTGDNAMKM